MASIKISQVEQTNDMQTDAYILVVQNGKNYRMSIKDAIDANVDLSKINLTNYYTKDETCDIVKNTIETHEIVADCGTVTTITEVASTVIEKTVVIDELTEKTESHNEQIVQLANIVENIKDVATEEDAVTTFDNIFEF